MVTFSSPRQKWNYSQIYTQQVSGGKTLPKYMDGCPSLGHRQFLSLNLANTQPPGIHQNCHLSVSMCLQLQQFQLRFSVFTHLQILKRSLALLPRSLMVGFLLLLLFLAFFFLIVRIGMMISQLFTSQTETQSFLNICCLFFFFFVCLGPYPWHMEVPRQGAESELQLLSYTTATATPDP